MPAMEDARLTERQRELLRLDAEGLTYHQIAARVNGSPWNVREAIRTAKRRLVVDGDSAEAERKCARAMRTRCKTCGLRGSHECIPPVWGHGIAEGNW